LPRFALDGHGAEKHGAEKLAASTNPRHIEP
jgi:hypothetical protein